MILSSSRIPSSVQSFTFTFQTGASAAVVGVIVIALAFAMLRRSRRQTCLYHIEELEGVVPSLPYRKQNADVETASVDSSESDVSVWTFTIDRKCVVPNYRLNNLQLQLQLPAPALLRAASHKTDAVATMREMHIEEPPIHSLSTSATTRPPLADHSSP